MRRFMWLAFVSMLGCIEQTTAMTAGPVEPPPEEPAPCDDYALGVNPEGDGACFAWAAVSCAAATERGACEEAVDIGSPNGDLLCAWASSAIAVDPDEACVEVDTTSRCLAAIVSDPETACDDTQRWIRFDEEAGVELLVTVDCGLHPVPDFDACVTETAAGICC